MSMESTAIIIADMVDHTQNITEAANRIEALYKLAADKQDNPTFLRTLYLDAQDNLGAVIKLEHKLYTYADLLRSVAGISLTDALPTGQPGCSRKTNGDR